MPHRPTVYESGLGNWHEAPATVGAVVNAVDTPAVLLDLDAFEHNIEEVHAIVQTAGINIRPHAKAHKCPDIALRQIQAGAVGICVQKSSEAEPFIEVGIKNILITNEVVGIRKVERVARMASHAHIGLCVDNIVQVQQIGAAARRHGVAIDIYVEVDVFHGRCGVSTPQAVLELVHAINEYKPSLVFAGLHAYRGSAQHLRTPQERSEAIAQAVTRVKEVIKALNQVGIEVQTVTGGGTGTFELEAESGVYTEVQPGSYVLMDTDYAANQIAPDMPVLKNPLQVLCTVISVNKNQAVLDGGLKAFATDHGLPKMLLPGWTVTSISDEHTVIVRDTETPPLKVGDKVKLLTGHCDPTVNLHDWIIAVRNDHVEEIWPISARGALF